MKILLTGGLGFIGSHTAVALLEAGHDAVIVDDLSNSSADVAERIEKISGKKPAVYICDAADADAMDRVFNENHIDAVIHFAGYKAVGESVRVPLKYYRNNLGTALTTLEVMRAHGVKRFVFSSSATVYGTENPVPYTEDMPAGGCTNPYGWTKFMIEQMLRDECAADSEFSAVLLRYFNPIGAHESGLIGERPNGIPNNLMPYITQVAAGKRDKLYVFGSDYPTRDGTGVRDYIHVCDLAEGHAAAIEYAAKHTGAQAINLGTGVGYSVLEVVETFKAANGIPLPYEMAARREGDLAEYYADTRLARRLLGWEARRGLAQMCRDAWNWEKNNL